MKLDHNGDIIDLKTRLPVIPLRDVVVFPHMMYPLLIGRQLTVNALHQAMSTEKQALLVAQRQAATDNPDPKDLYEVGVVARILQVTKMPNGTLKVLVEGLVRAKVINLGKSGSHLMAQVRIVPPTADPADRETEALFRTVSERFSEYVRMNRRVPDEVAVSVASIERYDHQVDTMAAHLLHKVETKQRLLAALTLQEQLNLLADILREEIEILKIEQTIEGNVRESMSRSQREFYLQQQLKAIKDELGQFDEPMAEVDDLYVKLESGNFPEAVRAKAEEEIKRLSKMHPYSAESAVVRSYLDWLLFLPWNEFTEDRVDFKQVKAILDGDHYGLDKAKSRILEHLAVIRLAGKVRGPILCLVGPPGVGKTSVGRSIARAMGRNFVRMSLGGVHDEAEIRGHRRTYVGALPGRIVQMIKKSGSSNPVLLLDEVDKIGKDFRGDPASALLEVLDPEQNFTFTDNYLEVEYDLSHVLFITTANTVGPIPPALRDRMEVIRLPGYLDFEKVAIATDYLIPKLQKELGLVELVIDFKNDTLHEIIRYYTRESGVREMERQIASMLRKTAVGLAEGKRRRALRFGRSRVAKLLGAPKYVGTNIKSSPTVGYAVGLAWTDMGGEVLPVEVLPMRGKAKLNLTGSLGEVMQESATAALSYIRNHAASFGLEESFFEELDLHVHIPEGAVPKDGPSAGVTLLTAMLSALTDVPVRTDIAMTGEITLVGDILSVGGLNEKLLAAKRLGVTNVILPEKNRKDINELQPDLLEGMRLHFVRTSREALKLAMVQPPSIKGKARARRLDRPGIRQ